MHRAFIVAAARTPVGAFGGALASLSAVELGTICAQKMLKNYNINPQYVDECVMGNVLGANLGQAPARQVAIGAGCGWDTPSTTINKVCSSGLKAAAIGSQQVMMGLRQCVLVGGFESMSQVPYYLPGARGGYRYGHDQVIDGVLKDGLWDVYEDQHMGMCAETCAETYGISREEQDDFAKMSYDRAIAATENGYFMDEVVPIEIEGKKGTKIVNSDEELERVDFDKISKLRPAFKTDGTVTAANASSLNDGAATLLIVNEDFLRAERIDPIAQITCFSDVAKPSVEFTTAPSLGIETLLQIRGFELSDIDCFEINEAFSVVALANMKLLGISSDRVNLHGGAVGLGHPIGCSGARILVTLLNVLRENDGRCGVAAICNGGGGASSMLIERLS